MAEFTETGVRGQGYARALYLCPPRHPSARLQPRSRAPALRGSPDAPGGQPPPDSAETGPPRRPAARPPLTPPRWGERSAQAPGRRRIPAPPRRAASLTALAMAEQPDGDAPPAPQRGPVLYRGPEILRWVEQAAALSDGDASRGIRCDETCPTYATGPSSRGGGARSRRDAVPGAGGDPRFGPGGALPWPAPLAWPHSGSFRPRNPHATWMRRATGACRSQSVHP